jgi:hypothetical protein
LNIAIAALKFPVSCGETRAFVPQLVRGKGCFSGRAHLPPVVALCSYISAHSTLTLYSMNFYALCFILYSLFFILYSLFFIIYYLFHGNEI